MSLATEAVRERLALTKWFRRNACVRHGVPWVEEEPIPEPSPAPAPPTAVATVVREAIPTWAKAVAAAVITAASLCTGAGLTYWLTSDQDAEPPADQPADSAQADGSLLQYLEDQGRHLPNGQ